MSIIVPHRFIDVFLSFLFVVALPPRPQFFCRRKEPKRLHFYKSIFKYSRIFMNCTIFKKYNVVVFAFFATFLSGKKVDNTSIKIDKFIKYIYLTFILTYYIFLSMPFSYN
ncbi:hypothetical protein BP951000_0615 [Brachyspira pilosicoli 95/1000]|uniref:Uncharacterized protein n=1 Tax=Brachyspira pilosicoli (strain ATCC BAA-1826 / 95/1000) TaxID=759914 RepID=D8IBU1_BRAP9|nr:hypothetical protein BP951000_0615 [Brachyspira pilosicoli 95/1000]